MPSVDRISWPAVPDAPLVLVPTGSTEQHGPHLPLGTDTAIAVAVAERAARELWVSPYDAEVLVAPPVSYGASGEHQHFRGTTSIGTESLRLVLVELVRSLSTWAGRVVFVNGHGGNVPALLSAVTQLVHEGHDVAWVPSATEMAGAHAGHTETSVMLHLAPALVDMSRAGPGNVAPIGELLPRIVADGVVAVSPNGVLGDPSSAHADEGRHMLDSMVDGVVGRLRRSERDSRGCLLPASGVPAPYSGDLSGA
ncbi:MAG: mycofactocin biosynthesis peptidyl-dipeptidase MftE [Actinomycetes bacterium]